MKYLFSTLLLLVGIKSYSQSTKIIHIYDIDKNDSITERVVERLTTNFEIPRSFIKITRTNVCEIKNENSLELCIQDNDLQVLTNDQKRREITSSLLVFSQPERSLK